MQPIERLIHMRSKKAIFRAFPAPPYGIGGGGGCGAGSGTSISGRGGSISGGGAGGLTGVVGCGGWVAMSFLLVASQRNKLAPVASRSEERRVGEEGCSTCNSRGAADNYKKNQTL